MVDRSTRGMPGVDRYHHLNGRIQVLRGVLSAIRMRKTFKKTRGKSRRRTSVYYYPSNWERDGDAPCSRISNIKVLPSILIAEKLGDAQAIKKKRKLKKKKELTVFKKTELLGCKHAFHSHDVVCLSLAIACIHVSRILAADVPSTLSLNKH